MCKTIRLLWVASVPVMDQESYICTDESMRPSFGRSEFLGCGGGALHYLSKLSSAPISSTHLSSAPLSSPQLSNPPRPHCPHSHTLTPLAKHFQLWADFSQPSALKPQYQAGRQPVCDILCWVLVLMPVAEGLPTGCYKAADLIPSSILA